MCATVVELLTAEAFWALPDADLRRELIDGVVVETMPPGGKHGMIAATLSWVLNSWARTGNHGTVGVESGFVLRRNPDLVRSPNVFLYMPSEFQPTAFLKLFWVQAPDLAIEIVSPSETAEDVRAKVRAYFAAGVALVWEVHPRTREVLIHTPDNTIRALDADATISDLAITPRPHLRRG